MLVLALLFACTFLIANVTGFLNIETIELLLLNAQSISPWYMACIVIALLFADLFIAVPTLTITVLSGFFLGSIIGFLASIIGMYLAGLGGYLLSSLYGKRFMIFVIKSRSDRLSLKESFSSHGFMMILLSRAAPILPEVTACMAGLTKMSMFKFLLAWSISSVPYAFIASYAGSISSIENPMPAIITAIGLTLFFWIGWFIFKKHPLKSLG